MDLPPIVKKYLEGRDLVLHSNTLIEIKDNTQGLHKRENKTKQVVLITGPTGAGKDTLVNALPKDKFVRWKTWTTRQEIRKDEMDADPYVRATREQFEEEISKGHFMEYNEYSGNLYGTHKREAEEAFTDGRIPVLRIDPRGALKFNEFSVNKQSVFEDANLHHFYVIPRTFEELEKRLRKREADVEIIERRTKNAKADLPFAVNAHYLLINDTDKIDVAIDEITSVLEG